MDYYRSAPNREETYRSSPAEEKIEKPIIGIKDIGTNVYEGRPGAFRDVIQAAIRAGTNSVELTLSPGGQAGFPSGPESYGKDERRELKEIAKASEINFTSVHVPEAIAGNLSGLGQRGFDDGNRQRSLDEVKKAISFAADVTDGSAIVVHTGEFPRPISEAKWAKDEEGNYLFKGYAEEPETSVIPLVDKRTGEVVYQVKKNQIVYTPKWLKNKKNQYVNYEGEIVDMDDRVPEFDEEKLRFIVKPREWEYFKLEAKERNKYLEEKKGRSLRKDEIITPEQSFYFSQLEGKISRSKGWSIQHSKEFKRSLKTLKDLKEAKKFYDNLDKSLPEEDKWKIMRETRNRRTEFADLIPAEYKPIPELIEDEIGMVKRDMDYMRFSTIGEDQAEKEVELQKKFAVPIGRFAKAKSLQSYAEAGIYAMEKTNSAKTKKPIFVAPENIFPEMGYGSHPEELIELVQQSRGKMVEMLTKKKIQDPSGKFDTKGNPIMINNPNYKGYSEEKAVKKAKEHIKATWDTAHMGMWWKHFESRPGESENVKRKRFNKWYQKEVEKMNKKGIIGHVHVADSFGYEDPHLPIGEGVLPVKTALEYLKEKGYSGTMISEAHGMGKGGMARQLVKTWEHLGASIGNIYAAGAPGERITVGDIHQSYFGHHRAPYTIFGAYAPSNDWTLWTQVPLE